jgi:hypothetical protein
MYTSVMAVIAPDIHPYITKPDVKGASKHTTALRWQLFSILGLIKLPFGKSLLFLILEKGPSSGRPGRGFSWRKQVVTPVTTYLEPLRARGLLKI